MTTEDIRHEIEREPFIPLRLHLATGQVMIVKYPHTAWVQQNSLLVVHPLREGTHEIGNYDVIALRLIERVEQLSESSAA